MGAMKNIIYLPNQPRPYRFRKTINKKIICRNFRTRADAEKFAKKFLATCGQEGSDALFFSREDKKLLAEIRRICGDTDPLEAVKWWKEHCTPRVQNSATTAKAFN